jgi:hypothetical protein
MTFTFTPPPPTVTWEQFWVDISVAQAAVWVIGFFALFTFVVKAWPFIRSFFQILDALVKLPAFIIKTDKFMDDTAESVKDIHHEVQFNNGSSVKDAVQRIENKVSKLEVSSQSLSNQLAEQDKKYDSLLD